MNNQDFRIQQCKSSAKMCYFCAQIDRSRLSVALKQTNKPTNNRTPNKTPMDLDAEAMRLFGPEIVSRAWGAKGKHSPFYLMCNAATLRFPVCDFCDAFYPASLYPELDSSSSPSSARRTCRGLVASASKLLCLTIGSLK